VPTTAGFSGFTASAPTPSPLITGRPESVFEAGVSAQGITIPEYEVEEDDWEDYIIEEPI
jgi:uncharacterized cysteine cluster protein YcgN (CxxCxxCC family)